MHEFELLGDPTRRRIVELLAHQELSVTLIAERLGVRVSASAVSHQLRILRDEEFVDVTEWGRERRYRLAWNAMDRLDAAVEALWVIWENRVGWPYPVLVNPPARLHRVGRSKLRGRTRADVEPQSGEADWWRFMSD
jgi:DNA-binding transcriptional ArsR family regulator